MPQTLTNIFKISYLCYLSGVVKKNPKFQRIMQCIHNSVIGLLISISYLTGSALAQGVLDTDFTLGLLKGSPLSLGGAYRALANDNSAILLNPAGIGQNRSLTIAADWLTSSRFDIDTYSGSIIDATDTERFATGFSFDHVNQDIFGNGVKYTQFTLAVAGNLTPGLSAGISGKYYQSSIESPVLTGPDGFTMDAGLLYFITPKISAAATIHNIFEGDGDPNIPLLVSGGIAVRPDERSALVMDVVQDFSTTATETTNLHFGGLYSITPDFTIRSGFGWDRIRDNSFFGAGFLITAQRAWLGLTYARHFDPSADTFAAFVEVRI